MALVKLQPDAQPPIQRTTPSTIQAPPQSVFTALVPPAAIASLLKYTEGYPWTVNFYGQLLNQNNTLENFDPTTPNLTQPYYKIHKLVLQVSSPLSSSYDQATGVTSITGLGVMPYKVTPNVGDVFVAQVDTGEDAIFHVTSVSRKTFRKDTLYEISYSLYSYTSASPEFLQRLEERVNDSYYFNTDTNFFNRDLLVKPSVQEATDRLKAFLHQSQARYLNQFSQRQTGTVLVPGIPYTLYDPLLVDFISRIVSYDQLVLTPFHRHHYISPEIDQMSIYLALLNRDPGLLHSANKTYGFLPTGLIPNRSRLGTAYHAGVDYILHPTAPDLRTQIAPRDMAARSEYLASPKTAKNYSGASPWTVKTTNNNQVYEMPLLHELFVDDYYVVSESFYDYLQDNSAYSRISYLEFLIAKYLRREAIAREDLAVAVERYSEWSLLHQLYLLPVLWLLVRSQL